MILAALGNLLAVEKINICAAATIERRTQQ